jgi:hypothetical protein
MSLQPITVEEAKRRLEKGDALTFVDARDDESWRSSEWQLPQARRLPPDDIETFLDDIPLGGLIVPYGSGSADVASVLIEYGWDRRPAARWRGRRVAPGRGGHREQADPKAHGSRGTWEPAES